MGRLVRPANCERCQGQSARIDAHHHNGYAPAHILDVTWLCRSCHQTVHGGDKSMIMPRGPDRPYEIVAAGLRARLAAEEWQSGEALPTVNALADHYQVSRATITRALRLLASEGLIRVVPRWGSFRI
jgi:hypothetical protein